jgi:hypothetical protein
MMLMVKNMRMMMLVMGMMMMMYLCRAVSSVLCTTMMYSILRRSREALVVSLVVVSLKNYNHTPVYINY